MKKATQERQPKSTKSYLWGLTILSLILNCLLLWLFINPLFALVPESNEDTLKVCQSDVDFYSNSESEQVLESIKSENYLAILWYSIGSSPTLRITTYISSYDIVYYNTGIEKAIEDDFKEAILSDSVEISNGKISFNGQEFTCDIPEDEWNSSIKDILVAWAKK